MKKNALVTLTFLLMTGLFTLSAQSARTYFQNDKTLTWKTFSQGAVVGQGELRISNVSNNTFDAEQTNQSNPGAGAQVLYGALFNGDKQVVLLNVGEYREAWVGTVSGDKIRGKIEGSNVDFEIMQKRAKPLQWVPYAGEMPDGAVVGGSENGAGLVVCRSFYNGANHAGKVVGGGCNFGWGGKEIVSKTYDVLVNEDGVSVQWVVYSGTIPQRAVVAGAEGNKNYYVGQCTRPDGSVHAGKVFGVPGNYIFNYGYGGKEITEPKNFRILVQGGN